MSEALPPDCPLFRGRARCALGPAMSFTLWWRAHGQAVRQYMSESRFYLQSFNTELSGMMTQYNAAYAATGQSERMLLRNDFEHRLFNAVQHLVRFETRNRAIVDILSISVDDVTAVEQRTLANAIQTRSVAQRSLLLINNMLDDINRTVHANYIYMVAGPTPQQHVERLILQVNGFLNETQRFSHFH